eukprot:TRINITY_DN6104_c0_g1_i1.p1 TRINITY_DN6104_c0_g1~~TRINITY_DN6104_c0_g1_i1.p1  ORF type:complete len:413 (-),score=74.46 TRINITY_DN6104_c0_g1_i1:76-1314(-)
MDTEATAEDTYRIWKKNAPYLYDVMISRNLLWPSLTVEWFPEKTVQGDYTSQRILFGTSTSGNEEATAKDSTVIIAEVQVPRDDLPGDLKFDESRNEIGGYGVVPARINTKIEILHKGDVNRARVMPQDHFFIATKTDHVENGECDVFVFNYSKHPSRPKDGDVCKPDILLKGHTQEGNGLAWNIFNKGEIISSGKDEKICRWVVPPGASEVKPLSVYSHHEATINDVAWHRQHQAYFGSVGDDSLLMFWDSRDAPTKPVHAVCGHTEGINCLSFNPFNEWLILTGGGDNIVGLWDLRNLKEPLYKFKYHQDGVYNVQWAPFYETIFASGGPDGTVAVWDVGKIETDESKKSSESPSELVFVHGGHVGVVEDFSWNPTEEWMLTSVGSAGEVGDNTLHVWQMAETIYTEATP